MPIRIRVALFSSLSVERELLIREAACDEHMCVCVCVGGGEGISFSFFFFTEILFWLLHCHQFIFYLYELVHLLSIVIIKMMMMMMMRMARFIWQYLQQIPNLLVSCRFYIFDAMNFTTLPIFFLVEKSAEIHHFIWIEYNTHWLGKKNKNGRIPRILITYAYIIYIDDHDHHSNMWKSGYV